MAKHGGSFIVGSLRLVGQQRDRNRKSDNKVTQYQLEERHNRAMEGVFLAVQVWTRNYDGKNKKRLKKTVKQLSKMPMDITTNVQLQQLENLCIFHILEVFLCVVPYQQGECIETSAIS